MVLIGEVPSKAKPLEAGSIRSSPSTSASVVFNLSQGSEPVTVIPLAVSRTVQSPVESVRLINTNLAPEAKPQFMV